VLEFKIKGELIIQDSLHPAVADETEFELKNVKAVTMSPFQI